MNNSCPSHDQLQDFVFGRLNDEVMAACSNHLTQCVTCLAVVQTVDLSSDIVCKSLKRLFQVTACESAPCDTSEADDAELKSATPDQGRAGSSFGRFDVLEQLGQGASGVVFRARDKRLNRDVALKIPRWPREALQRFRSEALIAAQLSHPHILQIYDVGDVDGLAYIASEYCAGPSLEEWLRTSDQKLDYRAAARIAMELTRAVEYAHRRGILHRDIKASNVILQPVTRGGSLVDHSGTGWIPKLGDFGLAAGIMDGGRSDEVERKDSLPVGTPQYMAPEVIVLGGQAATTSSDIYSLGVLLYLLLTDRAPFHESRFIESLRRDDAGSAAWPPAAQSVSEDLKAICVKCLSKSPLDRYRDAGLLADDLARFLEDRPVSARRRSGGENIWYWLRKHPTVAAMIAVALCSLAAWYVNLQSHRQQLEAALARAERGEGHARAHANVALLRLASGAIEAREFELARHYLDRAEELGKTQSGPGVQTSFENRYLRGLLPDVRPQSVVDAHVGGTTSLAFVEENRTLASAGQDGSIAVWTVPQLALARRWNAHQGDVNRLLRHDNGKLIASCGDDGYVRVWNAETGQKERERYLGKKLFELAFCQQGKVLLAGGDTDEIIGWDWDRNEEAFRLPGPKTRALAFQSQTEALARADMNAGLSLAKLADSIGQAQTPVDSDRRINDVTFSPDGQFLAASNRDGRIFVWSTKLGMSVGDWKGHIDAVHAIKFLPDGRRLVSVSTDKTVAIWETTGRLISRFHADMGAIWSLDLSSDERWIATGDNVGKLKLWSVGRVLFRKNSEETTVEGTTGGRFAALLRPSAIVTTSAKGALAIRKFGSIDDVADVGDKMDQPDLLDLAAHPSGHLVLGANLQGDVAGWSIPGGKLEFKVPGNSGRLFAIEFPTKSNCFVTASESGDVTLHSISNGKPLRTLWRHQDLALCLAVTPDGRCLASGGEDRQIIVGSIDTNSDDAIPARYDRIDHTSIPSALCFLDRENLVIGDHEGRVSQWDLMKKQIVGNYPGTEDRILVLVQSPDRQTLVAGCRGGRILFWNIESRQPSLELQAKQDSAIRNLHYSPDGVWLVASVAHRDGGGAIQLFKAPASSNMIP